MSTGNITAWRPPAINMRECGQLRNFQKHGVRYVTAEKPKSELYLDLIPQMPGRKVELPDDKRLLQELRRLERRRGRSGRDIIDHGPSGHDDLSNVIAGVVFLIASKPQLSKYAVPIGVGRGIGADLRRSFGPLAMDKPLNGDLPLDEERPGKGGAWRYRFYFGSED